jgi:hypothetical protein
MTLTKAHIVEAIADLRVWEVLCEGKEGTEGPESGNR